MYAIIYYVGMGPTLPEFRCLYEPRLGFSKQLVRCGFHTVRGCIDFGGHRFRPRFVVVVDVRKDS